MQDHDKRAWVTRHAAAAPSALAFRWSRLLVDCLLDTSHVCGLTLASHHTHPRSSPSSHTPPSFTTRSYYHRPPRPTTQTLPPSPSPDCLILCQLCGLPIERGHPRATPAAAGAVALDTAARAGCGSSGHSTGGRPEIRRGALDLDVQLHRRNIAEAPPQQHSQAHMPSQAC